VLFVNTFIGGKGGRYVARFAFFESLAEIAKVTELNTFLFSAERAENKKHYPFG